MDCQESFKLMSLYLDGELDKERQSELFKHIDSCEHCKSEFEFLKNMVSELNDLEFLPLPEDFHDELMEKISEEKVEPKKLFSGNMLWRKYATLAAAVAFLFIGGVGGNAILHAQKGNESASLESSNQYFATDSAGGARFAPADTMAVAENSDSGAGVMQKMQSDSEVPPIDGNQSERKRIKNASISITIDSFDNTMGEIKKDVESKGGYVENFNSYIFYEDAEKNIFLKSGTINVRIGQDNYDEFLQYVKTLGKVSNENEYVNDVTSQYIDIEARLGAKKAEESRLIELLGKAQSVADIVSIEARLSEVRGFIESFEQQLKDYDKLVSFSSINIELTEKEPQGVNGIASDFGEKIKDGFVKSFNYVTNGFQGLIVGIVVISMPTLILAFIIFAIYKIVRRIVGKKRNKVEEKEPEIKE